MPTKILLTGGHTIEVEQQPSEIADILTRREDVHRFTAENGGDVYVVKGQIVGFEQNASS